ncbi:MAG: ABC transporter permease [Candidatus Wallbacteria bacterium]|nr:ABC transporter permease [Candidatus Wallbacteria bacterium]
MGFGEVLRTALWSLGRSRTRTGLTMLGIIIGVAAVVAVVSLGQGAISNTENDIASMGINLVTVTPGSKIMSGFRMSTGSVVTLVPEDAVAIREECPSVALVSPGVKTQVQVVYQDKNSSSAMEGGSTDYPAIRGWALASGGFFDADQERQSAKVCAIGETVRKHLFGDADPIGKMIRVNKIPLLVVGLFAPKGQTSTGQDQDDVVVVPWTTGMRRLMGLTHLTMMLAAAREESGVKPATVEISKVLRRRHHIGPNDEDDFTCQTQREVAETAESATVLMMTLVSVIALIALFVGGVGVMNIMLVSVLERTREIGIRMAIGARSSAVMWQFLGETVVLTSLGGLIGAALGIGLAQLIPLTLGWPTRVTAAPVVVSFLFSAAVGIFFGLYPAYQASRMDPIEALRYE